MYGIDSADSVASKPTPSTAGTSGWFKKADAATSTRGTVATSDWFNLVNGELKTILTALGIAEDKTSHTQISDALGGAYAIKSHATDTGAVTTGHLRAVIASGTGRADGAHAAALAVTGGARASGAQSAVIASNAGEASGIDSALLATNGGAQATGTRCAVIASSYQGAAPTADGDNACTIAARGDVDNDGDQCVAIAVDGATNPINIAAGADQCAVIASSGPTAACSIAASATSSAMVAARSSTLSGVGTFVLGSSRVADVSGSDAGVVACDGGAGLDVQSSGTLVVASGFTGALVVNETDTLCGGAGTALTWKIRSASGDIDTDGDVDCVDVGCTDVNATGNVGCVDVNATGDVGCVGVDCDTLDVDNGIALGADPVATLGQTGGTGPGTAAQAQWLEVAIGGTAHWIAVWT